MSGGHWIRLCFPSSAPTALDKFYCSSILYTETLFPRIPCSSKSFAMASHSSGDEGGCKYVFQKTLYIASHVLDIIFDTVEFPIWHENDKDCCDSLVARNHRVIESLSSADVVFQKFVSFFKTNGSTSFSKWSKRSGDIRVYLWKSKTSVQCFTYYPWPYGSRRSEVFLRIRKNHWKIHGKELMF